MSSAFVGYYESTVENLKFDYSRPQENGYRTENRWLRMVNLDGKGFEIKKIHSFLLEPISIPLRIWMTVLEKSTRSIPWRKKKNCKKTT